MDFTYISVNDCNSRLIYINAVKELFNGKIVVYDLSLRNDVELVNSILVKLYKPLLKRNCIRSRFNLFKKCIVKN